MFASAGLLHDIGRVIIYQYFMEEFKEALNIMKENPNKSIVEIENETIGVDHQK